VCNSSSRGLLDQLRLQHCTMKNEDSITVIC
jgi:hypothetical protein